MHGSVGKVARGRQTAALSSALDPHETTSADEAPPADESAAAVLNPEKDLSGGRILYVDVAAAEAPPADESAAALPNPEKDQTRGSGEEIRPFGLKSATPDFGAAGDATAAAARSTVRV